MEADAHQAVLDRLARGQQQGGGLIRGDAELARQGIGGAVRRHAHAHDQVQIVGLAGGLEDLVQLVMAVQHEGAHAVIGIGGLDRAAALDRVHEGQARVRADRTDQLDLGERGDVEGVDALFDQGLDDPARRVRLHRIEDVGFQIVLEPGCRYGDGARTHECDRTFRGPLTDQVQGNLVRAQLT
ncbi:hypothetical protein D3C73_1161140 [compost metagenome]